MDAYTIIITGDGKTREMLDTLSRQGVPAGMNNAAAKAAGDVVREHLMRLDGERANQLGGKRSHFYWEAAKSVTHSPTVDGAEVVIDKLGLRQRWLGGTITAKNAKYLTIPARAESYNVPARQFPQKLRFVSFRSGAKALVIDDRQEVFTESVDDAGNVSAKRGFKRNKRKKTGGIVEYWLVPSVYQKPDPSVIPGPDKLTEAATEAINEYFAENYN